MTELSKAELDEPVEDAVVDSYGEDEQCLPVPPPPGAEWIAAYRRWASGR